MWRMGGSFLARALSVEMDESGILVGNGGQIDTGRFHVRKKVPVPLHFPPWIQMHPHQFSVTWGVPWDADLVILSIALVKTSLFTTLNYQFPFWETLSHDGVRRRLEASSTHSRSGIASASHNIALQGKASCAAAQRLSEEPRIMQ
jgi:hypothetical protein